MTIGEKQLSEWRGDFGDAYILRNQPTPEVVRQHAAAFAKILSHVEGAPPKSILEGGANVGINLRALKSVTGAELFAVEPNATARQVLVDDGVVAADHAHDGFLANLPFADGAIDLVFTAGVLIHVPDDALEASYRDLHRVAGRYILSIEYFSPNRVEIPYRGHTDLLFKRDYGGLWLDMFDDLELVADGFLWRRTTGWDNQNWWLFRKK